MKRKRRMFKLARIIKPFIQENFCVFLNIVSFQKLRIIHARWQVRRYIQKIDGAGTKTSVFVVLNWCRTWRSWSPGKSVVWNLFAIVCFFQAVQLMNQFVNRWIWRTLLLLMPLQKVFPYDSLSTANVSLLSTLGLHSFRGGSFNTMSSRFSRTSANFSQARWIYPFANHFHMINHASNQRVHVRIHNAVGRQISVYVGTNVDRNRLMFGCAIYFLKRAS